jgi:hypothetical protein
MSHRTRIAAAIAAGLVFAVASCSDRPPSSPTAPDTLNPQISRTAASPPEPVSAVARGIAAALAGDDLRTRLLEDLRDSPFPRHSLHLASYLAGERGLPLARAAAAATGLTPGEFLRRVSDLPEMQVWMMRPIDRTRWTATADVVVVATTAGDREVAERGHVDGFTTAGVPVDVPVDGPWFARPLLAITPARQPFGADPEAVRAAAPHSRRGTISTVTTELGTTTCDPLTAVTECDSETMTGPVPFQGGIQLAPDITMSDCTANLDVDADHDGFRDECEYQLASAFRPLMHVSYLDGTLARDSYWAVRRDPATNRVHVFYALAYLRDGGTPNTGLFSHAGDSEFIIVQLHHAGSGLWQMDAATLSAHWQEGWGLDGTGTWGYQDFNFTLGFRGRPDVWVAEEKHANYKTQAQCDAGAFYKDTCDQNTMLQEPLVARERNLGNGGSVGTHLRDCVGTTVISTSRYECFWDPAWYSFWGWQSATTGATPYHDSLGWYGF